MTCKSERCARKKVLYPYPKKYNLIKCHSMHFCLSDIWDKYIERVFVCQYLYIIRNCNYFMFPFKFNWRTLRMRNFCAALWLFPRKNSYKLTQNNIQLLNPLKTFNMLDSKNFPTGLNFPADYHSFALPQSTHFYCESVWSSSVFFGGPTLCEMGLIAGIYI